MYGRDTSMRFASSVCDTPSSFIRSRMRLKNAEPILSIAFNGLLETGLPDMAVNIYASPAMSAAFSGLASFNTLHPAGRESGE